MKTAVALVVGLVDVSVGLGLQVLDPPAEPLRAALADTFDAEERRRLAAVLSLLERLADRL
jgi:hypothetical protein